jgi:hypothetical protein
MALEFDLVSHVYLVMCNFFGFMKIWGHFVSLGELHNYYLPKVKLSLNIR